MTSKIKLAISIDESHERLKKYVPMLAEQAHIESPDLFIPLRYNLEYRRAMELERLSVFIEHLAQSSASEECGDSELKKLVSRDKGNWTKDDVVKLVLGEI